MFTNPDVMKQVAKGRQEQFLNASETRRQLAEAGIVPPARTLKLRRSLANIVPALIAIPRAALVRVKQLIPAECPEPLADQPAIAEAIAK